MIPLSPEEREALDAAEGEFFRKHGPKGDWKYENDFGGTIWRAAVAWAREDDAKLCDSLRGTRFNDFQLACVECASVIRSRIPKEGQNTGHETE